LSVLYGSNPFPGHELASTTPTPQPVSDPWTTVQPHFGPLFVCSFILARWNYAVELRRKSGSGRPEVPGFFGSGSGQICGSGEALICWDRSVK